MDLLYVREQLERRLRAAIPDRAGRVEMPLPNGEAHRLLAPVPRPGWIPGTVPEDGIAAAVLVLLYRLADSEEIGLLLTKRTAIVASHRRQISFPGGAVEVSESLEETALRETEEEAGIARELPELLGRMSPLWISATGYTVTPILAVVDRLPRLKINADEVAAVIEQPLPALLAPNSVKVEKRTSDGLWIDAPFFDTSGGRLWGATAMMTAELLVMLGWQGPNS